jgi:hypothetical protein
VALGIGLARSEGEAASTAGVIGGVVGALATGLIETVLIVGLYRLMLRPADPGFLHLRFGRDEGRLFLVGLILVAGVALLVGVAVGFSQLLEKFIPAGRIVTALLALAMGGWLALRLGLAAPISFAERRIDLRRSWRMTRGRAASLLGMWFLNFCLVMLVWLVLWLAVFVLSGLLTGFHGFGSAEGGEALESHPGRYLIEAVIPILSMPALLVLSHAPWVAVYRDLASEAPTPP